MVRTDRRRCPRCDGGMSADGARALLRRYSCNCGYDARLFTVPMLVGLGLVGSTSALSAGRAWSDGELTQAAVAAAVMLAVVGALAHNIWLRRRCPRVS